jgi:hypothetical protein
MKKTAPRSRKKTAKGGRKTIMRHSREGARPGAKRKSKSKAKPKRKQTAARKTKARPKPRPAKASTRRPSGRRSVDTGSERGIGAGSAGQSGDTEGLPRTASADSESVEELLEEGQSFEAGVVSGVEEGRRGGRRGVRTRQVPEDDVPQEYLDQD